MAQRIPEIATGNDRLSLVDPAFAAHRLPVHLRGRTILHEPLSAQVCHIFATNHLRDGVAIRNVQAWFRHRDIKSAMLYLNGIRSKDAAHKVNSGELAGLVA